MEKGEVQYKSRSRVYQLLRIPSLKARLLQLFHVLLSEPLASYQDGIKVRHSYVTFCLNTRQQDNTHHAIQSNFRNSIFSAGLPRLRVNASICAGAAHQLRGYCLTTALQKAGRMGRLDIHSTQPGLEILMVPCCVISPNDSIFCELGLGCLV